MADIKFACPKCRQEFEAPDSMCGQITLCPKCQESIVVPDQGTIRTIQPSAWQHLLADKTVVLKDVDIPFNSICWICLKVIFALILISCGIGGVISLIYLAFAYLLR